MIMAYRSTIGAEPLTLEYELAIDVMAQRIQCSFKFKNFYDQMGFSPEQCLAITKAIIELTGQLGSSNLAERSP